MRRYPVASLVAIFSLAAGIGATTVHELTVRDVIFRRPPQTYQQPEQLSKIEVGSPENPLRPVGNPVPIALYQSWRETIGPSMAAWMSLGEREVRAADRLESISVRAVTPELFQILGRAGRSFSKSDSSASRTAIVNDALARHSFQGQDAIGSRLWIAGIPHDVVGVVADYASNPLRAGVPEPRVFVPLPLDSKDIRRLTFLVRAVNDPSTLVPTVPRPTRARSRPEPSSAASRRSTR